MAASVQNETDLKCFQRQNEASYETFKEHHETLEQVDGGFFKRWDFPICARPSRFVRFWFFSLTLQSLPFWQNKKRAFPLCRTPEILGKERQKRTKKRKTAKKKRGKKKQGKMEGQGCCFPIFGGINLFRFFRDFPICPFPLSRPTKALTRNIPERSATHSARTFPEKSGKLPGLKAPRPT